MFPKPLVTRGNPIRAVCKWCVKHLFYLQKHISHEFDVRPWTIHGVMSLRRPWLILIMLKRKSLTSMDQKLVSSRNHAKCMHWDRDELVHNPIGLTFWGEYYSVIKQLAHLWSKNMIKFLFALLHKPRYTKKKKQLTLLYYLSKLRETNNNSAIKLNKIIFMSRGAYFELWKKAHFIAN